MNTSRTSIAALSILCAALSVGCSTYDGRNAALGAAGGAVVGAVAGGSALTGAAVGAVAGAVIGRLVIDGRERQVHSDGRGGRYWVDEDGRQHAVR